MSTTLWLGLPHQEASAILYDLILNLLIQNLGHYISTDISIRVLTQRLYGDYRQVHMTNEYKRAEKEMKIIASSPLWKVLR